MRKPLGLGITCTNTREVSVIHEAASWITSDWVQPWVRAKEERSETGIKLYEADAYIAYSDGIEPIAMSLVLLDTEVAYLFWSDAMSDAGGMVCRYLLYAAIVDDLISRGVRCVVVDSVIRLSSGLQYFEAR